MQASRITVAHLTPALGSLLLASDRKALGKLDSLRFAFFGGEMLKYPLVRKLKESAPNATVLNCYGTTETPQIMGFHVVTDDEIIEALSDGTAMSTVPIGKGIDGAQLLVLDEHNQLCAPAHEGQIAVRSPYLAKEVRREDGRALDVFRPNPHGIGAADRMYPTGDYGYYRSDGSVVCTGRKDRQIKIRGHRLQLEEIEHVLASAPGVSQYQLDVETSQPGDPLIILYAVFSEAEAAHDRLRELLASQLPPFMVPAMIVPVDALPRTPNGKVDLHQLRAKKSPAKAKLEPGLTSDLTPVESELLRIFSAQTAGMISSPDDDLTTAGLDSLRRINACCAIEAALGATFSVGEILECRTIRGIAALLQRTSPMPENAAGAGATATFRTPVPSGSTGTASPEPATTSAPLVSPNHPARLFPENENLLAGVKNRVLQLLARNAPDAWRIRLHRLRGVQIGDRVSIGYDSIVETAYPWLVRIGNNVNIGMRVTIIGHFRGMARRERGHHSVDIQDYAFVGPGVLILPSVTIGRGAVVTAGSIVNTPIPPFVLAHGNPAKPIARCGVSLSGKTTYEDFLRQLRPLEGSPS